MTDLSLDGLDDLLAPAVIATAADPPPAKRTRQRKQPTMKGKGPLYLDIETIPDHSREHLFGLEPLPQAAVETPMEHLLSCQEFLSQSIDAMKECMANKCPPDHWIDGVEETEVAGKKRKGVLEYLKELRKLKDAAVVAHANRIKTMSVTPEFCRIVALGLMMGADEPNVEFAETEEQEAAMLGILWKILANYTGPIVVFNGLSFDLPAIFVRSSILGVQPTRRIDLKPWGNDVIDIYAVRFPRGSSTPMGQQRLTVALEVEDADADPDTGAKVYDQFRAKEFDKIVDHNRKDLVRLRGLHAMYQGFFCN